MNSEFTLIIVIIAMIMIVATYLLYSSVSMVITSFHLDITECTIFVSDFELIPVWMVCSVHVVLTGGLHNITAGTVDWLARPMDDTTPHTRVESGLQGNLPRRVYSLFWLPTTGSKHVVRIILNGIRICRDHTTWSAPTSHVDLSARQPLRDSGPVTGRGLAGATRHGPGGGLGTGRCRVGQFDSQGRPLPVVEACHWPARRRPARRITLHGGAALLAAGQPAPGPLGR
jgi:hypothetical protein